MQPANLVALLSSVHSGRFAGVMTQSVRLKPEDLLQAPEKILSEIRNIVLPALAPCDGNALSRIPEVFLGGEAPPHGWGKGNCGESPALICNA